MPASLLRTCLLVPLFLSSLLLSYQEDILRVSPCRLFAQDTAV